MQQIPEITPPLNEKEAKLANLLKTVKKEADFFVEMLEQQLRCMAYTRGLMQKSTALVFDDGPGKQPAEKDNSLACMDFSRDSKYVVTFFNRKMNFKDNQQPKDNAIDKSKPLSGPMEFVLEDISLIGLRFDSLDFIWKMDRDGTVTVSDRVANSSKLVIHKSDEMMIPSNFR